MRKLNTDKLKQLKTADSLLDEKYGENGTSQRMAFDADCAAWYFGELLKERRKSLNMTQEDLAVLVNSKRTYISRVERGVADIQMSSFFKLASALGIRFIPEFV
ncbi:MAG: helix-turn-helix domain-containing protein [Paludibacteraceae bacterium]|nr:helix-turn-helix domain-containing protein [Paludibacteraceae bacterium]